MRREYTMTDFTTLLDYLLEQSVFFSSVYYSSILSVYYSSILSVYYS